LSLLISLIGIILTIVLVIGIHECGHFLAARWLGVKVLRFSIGFGKALWRRSDKKGTEYVLAAIPLGGYIKMLDEDEGHVPENQRHLAFNRQPFYKKFLIVAAGPFANLVLAFVLYWLLFVVGFTSMAPVIGKVAPHSIAFNAGLKSQQEIISIDNTPTTSWMSVIIRIYSHAGETDQLQIETKPLGGQTSQKHILDLTHWHMNDLKPDPLDSLGFLPYEPEFQWPKGMLRQVQYNPVAALPHAWRSTYDFVWLNFLVVGKLLTGKASLQSLGGPISIFQSAGQAINQGIAPFMSFLAFISISIGTINIFPIPGLDGGHLLFQTIEAIIRRPIPQRVLILFYRLGVILLLLLVFHAITNDILRLT